MIFSMISIIVGIYITAICVIAIFIGIIGILDVSCALLIYIKEII